MNKDTITNNDGLEVISSLIDSPLIVVDSNGSVITVNKYLQQRTEKNPIHNIFDVLDTLSSADLNNFIKQDDIKMFDISNASLCIDGLEERYDLLVKRSKDDNLFYCLFSSNSNRINYENQSNILIKENDVLSLIDDESIKKVINEVKENYPFSFIGKEKVKKLINSISNMFWLKDAEGNYIMVNNAFAEGLGVKILQIEGKKEKDYIPAFLLKFFNSVEDYIIQTANSVILEGIPVKGIKSLSNLISIEIPVLDSKGKVICIIGVTQKEINKTSETVYPLNFNLFNELSTVFVLTGEDGKIIFANNIFYKLFDLEEQPATEINIKDHLEKENCSKFLNFVQDEKIINFNFKEKEKSFLCVKLVNNNKLTGIKIEEDTGLEKDIPASGRNFMFDLLIQNNPEPVFIYDKENLKFLDVNKAALNLYGYRKEEFLQMDLTDLYSPEDIQTLLNESNFKDGEFTGPYRHKRKDGSSIYVEIGKTKISYQNKDSHFNIVRDVSSKLEQDKKLKIYKAAFDNSESILIITDATGFINYANETANKLLSQAKLTGNSFVSLVPDKERKNIISEIFQNSVIEEREILTEIKFSDNEFKEVSLKVIPITDFKNEIDAFILLAKYTQEQIIQVKEVIKEIIKEVPIVQTESKIVKQNSEFITEEFLSHLFHDLLTPINAILGFSQELSESINNKNPEQQEAIDIIVQSRNNLLETMNSVIEYASFETNNESVTEYISILDIIDQLQIADAKKKGKSEIKFVKVSSSLKFTSDKEKFMKFVLLLMKITSIINQEKDIYLSTYQLDDDNFILTVKTNKTNISSAVLEKFKYIFQKKSLAIEGVPKFALQLLMKLYNQLKGKFVIPESNSNYAGFIFPLVNNFEDVNLGGQPEPVAVNIEEEKPFETAKATKKETPKPLEVEVEEEEDFEPVKKQSTFSRKPQVQTQDEQVEVIEEKIETPVKKAKKILQEEVLLEEKPQEKVKEEKPKTNFKVDLSKLSCLYIEDQTDSQILFKMQMKGLKDLKFAVSFEEALPLLEQNKFDIILLDINLQGEYNGLDALRLIRQIPQYKNTPVIAATAYVLPGDHEKFIATGFNEFLSKPLVKEQIMEVFEKLM